MIDPTAPLSQKNGNIEDSPPLSSGSLDPMTKLLQLQDWLSYIDSDLEKKHKSAIWNAFLIVIPDHEKLDLCQDIPSSASGLTEEEIATFQLNSFRPMIARWSLDIKNHIVSKHLL